VHRARASAGVREGPGDAAGVYLKPTSCVNMRRLSG
jgi:hypothetical protein